jgi:hypothetical protein
MRRWLGLSAILIVAAIVAFNFRPVEKSQLPRRLERVQIGMTQKEVYAEMGKPHLGKKGVGASQGLEQDCWEDEWRRVWVRFSAGVVVAKGGDRR